MKHWCWCKMHTSPSAMEGGDWRALTAVGIETPVDEECWQLPWIPSFVQTRHKLHLAASLNSLCLSTRRSKFSASFPCCKVHICSLACVAVGNDYFCLVIAMVFPRAKVWFQQLSPTPLSKLETHTGSKCNLTTRPASFACHGRA